MQEAKPPVRAAADTGGKSPHAFMREALGAKAQRVEQRQALLRAALAAEEEAQASGRGYRASEVDAYFDARGAERPAPLPALRSMARVVYTRAAFDDLREAYDATAADDPTLAANLSASIRRVVGGLERDPLSGRIAEDGLRESAISRGRTGYVVLYRLLGPENRVLVLAVRRRTEAGYFA